MGRQMLETFFELDKALNRQQIKLDEARNIYSHMANSPEDFGYMRLMEARENMIHENTKFNDMWRTQRIVANKLDERARDKRNGNY